MTATLTEARIRSAQEWLEDSAKSHEQSEPRRTGFAQHNRNASKLLAELGERLAAMEANSARYVWLRDNAGFGFYMTLESRREPDEWDAEIDTAKRAES